jgi:hypothetical protein
MERSSQASAAGMGIERLFPAGLKKAVLAGVGALFMTEDGIRSVLGDLKLPKDVAQFLINQVARTKEDLFRVLSHELRDFLESTNLAEELRSLLTTTSLEINTRVRFIPAEDGVRPRTKFRVKVHRRRKGEAAKPSPTEGSKQA